MLFLGSRGHFNDMFVTFWWHFSYFVGPWGPSGFPVRKSWKKGVNKPKVPTPFWEDFCVLWQLIFHDFLEDSWDGLFPILVAKVSQMRAPWDHFSARFVEQLERWNLWFRIGQTTFLRVLRGWVEKYWATVFNWFSKPVPGVPIYVFSWNVGHNRDPKESLWAPSPL